MQTLKPIKRPDFRELDEDMSAFSSLLLEIMDRQSSKFVSQQNIILLDALRKYIPEITYRNIKQYAHRITIGKEEGKLYPQQFFLDFGTPNETLVITLLEPKVEFDYENCSGKMTQTYQLP